MAIIPFHLNSSKTNVHFCSYNMHSLSFAVWSRVWLPSTKMQASTQLCGYILWPCYLRKDLANNTVFSCWLNNSQHLKIIWTLWSALWFWFQSLYKRCEINLNLPKLMCNFQKDPAPCKHPDWISWNLIWCWLPMDSGTQPWKGRDSLSCSLSVFGSFCSKPQGDWPLLWHVSGTESIQPWVSGGPCLPSPEPVSWRHILAGDLQFGTRIATLVINQVPCEKAHTWKHMKRTPRCC